MYEQAYKTLADPALVANQNCNGGVEAPRSGVGRGYTFPTGRGVCGGGLAPWLIIFFVEYSIF